MESEKKSRVTLKTIAILTCLSEIPAKDSFRPPYAGTNKPIYREKDIQWPILFASLMLDNPQLAELPSTAFFQEDTQTYYGEGW